MPIELKVPAVGESVAEVFIGQWHKAEGDAVAPDEGLVEVESEKATLDVPAPAGGVLVKILKQSGQSAQVGETIAHIEARPADGAAQPAPAKSSRAHDANGAGAPPAQPSAERQAAKPAAAPPDAVSPSGYATPPSPREKWIIRQEPAPPRPQPSPAPKPDEQRAGGGVTSESGAVVDRPAREASAAPVPPSSGPAEAPPAAAPSARPSPAPPVDVRPPAHREEETIPLSPIRRRIAARLVEAQHNAALLTTFNEIDMTAVKQLRAEQGEAFQNRHGTKLGFMSFFVKAAVDALRHCPELNAVIDGDALVYRRYFDIGVAIGSQRGLVVPVLRNAEAMSFAAIEKTIEDFGRRAQSGELRVDELQGGTFTISNGGVFGSLLSTPIVNPPQSGVLGMHAIQNRPIAVGDHVVIRPMMYVALTYDHRVVDGREAVTFLRGIKESIEAPARMLLEL